MNDDSRSRIDGFLDSSARELFRSCGIEIEPLPYRGGGMDRPFSATIGFTSTTLHGSLILTLSRDLAARSMPRSLQSAAAQDGIVADWTGELSNQMLGRLKNCFHAAGVDIELSTPVIFAGTDLRHFSHESTLSRSLQFAHAESGGSILVELQADCAEGFELGEDVASESDAAQEGNVLLF